MILQPGEETGARRARRCSTTACSRAFPKPDVTLAFHDAAVAARRARSAITPRLCARQRRQRRYRRARRRRPRRLSADDEGSDRPRVADRHWRCRRWSAARTIRSEPAVVTVGSFHSGTKHNIISDEAKLQLTVRSYTPEVRKLLLDGIAPHRPGEAIAAGMPEDRMPVVPSGCDNHTPATFNTPAAFRHRLLELFSAHFGADRVVETQAGHGRRGFQPLLACRQVQAER